MAKLTSQNSSKSKTANAKATTEEKKPKGLSKKAAFAAKKISQSAAQDQVQAEDSRELHVSVVATNGHSGLSKLAFGSGGRPPGASPGHGETGQGTGLRHLR